MAQPVKILLDSALLLNDFFHRHPEVGSLRTGKEPTEELLTFWQASHEALLFISINQPYLQPCITEAVALRLAAVLSDFALEPARIQEEISWWQSSFEIIPASLEEMAEGLAKGIKLSPEGPLAEDLWMSVVMPKKGITGIVTPWTRRYTPPGRLRWLLPQDLEGFLNTVKGGQ